MNSQNPRLLKYLFSLVLVYSVSAAISQAQYPAPGDVIIKNLPRTILGKRILVIPEPFDGQKALRKLFPGRWYDLSKMGYTNKFSSWSCRSCKAVGYTDVNGVEDALAFPYKTGVATRLLNVLDFSDSCGKKHKLLSFNHSDYDPDGFQTGRFTGGLVGIAEFKRTDGGWRLQTFQPAIAAYGAFSQAPHPELVLIGKKQYAFMVKHFNGGPGEPYYESDFLIASVDDVYRQILAAYGTTRENVGDTSCAWTNTFKVAPGGKTCFRDIIITCKGHYWTADREGLPEELKGKVERTVQGYFTIRHVFEYSAKKGYQERLPAHISVNSKTKT